MAQTLYPEFLCIATSILLQCNILLAEGLTAIEVQDPRPLWLSEQEAAHIDPAQSETREFVAVVHGRAVEKDVRRPQGTGKCETFERPAPRQSDVRLSVGKGSPA